VAFICSSLEPHLRQWTRGGSADSASKSSSTDWTTVDEMDGDLLTMTRFLGIEIRLAIAGTRHLRKVRDALSSLEGNYTLTQILHNPVAGFDRSKVLVRG